MPAVRVCALHYRDCHNRIITTYHADSDAAWRYAAAQAIAAIEDNPHALGEALIEMALSEIAKGEFFVAVHLLAEVGHIGSFRVVDMPPLLNLPAEWLVATAEEMLENLRNKHGARTDNGP